MNQDKSKTMDAAEKLMLDLMEKHPGASEILAAGPIPKPCKGKTRGVASNRWPFYEAQLTTAILQRAADGSLSRMSAIGTKRTSMLTLSMSALRGITDMTRTGRAQVASLLARTNFQNLTRTIVRTATSPPQSCVFALPAAPPIRTDHERTALRHRQQR